MTINVHLLSNTGFVHDIPSLRANLGGTAQTQTFQDFQIQNGYGSATKVSVTPGYGATVIAKVDIQVASITEQTFSQIIQEVKTSSKYSSDSSFKQMVDSSSYSSAGSSSCGIFGWLLGGGSSSYSNQTSHLTNEINEGSQGAASNDATVANSVANIMVNNSSTVHVTADIAVTGQLLTPQPTIIAVETTTFRFTDQNGNSSSVTMLNQTPLVAVNPENNTVSGNTLAPGSSLKVVPI